MKKYLLLLTFCFYSCETISTDTEKDNSNDFLFKVTVKNSAGQPVQGLRVSVYNKQPIWGEIPKVPPTVSQNYRPATSVEFTVPVTAKINVAILELDDNIVQVLSDSNRHFAGRYRYSVSLNKMAGTRVYKFRIIAFSDSTQQVLYRDSIYITLWQIDPLYSILGYTSNEGNFETNDSLAFPNILSLPPMIITNEKGPEPIGSFKFSDSVSIVLADTTSLKSFGFVHKVVKGKNNFDLTWNSSSFNLSKSYPKFYIKTTSTQFNFDTVRRDDIVPKEWKLFQNYPNPFN